MEDSLTNDAVAEAQSIAEQVMDVFGCALFKGDASCDLANKRPRYVTDCGCPLSEAGLNVYIQNYRDSMGNPGAKAAGLDCILCGKKTFLAYKPLNTIHMGEIAAIVTTTRQRHVIAQMQAELVNIQKLFSETVGKALSRLQVRQTVDHSPVDPTNTQVNPGQPREDIEERRVDDTARERSVDKRGRSASRSSRRSVASAISDSRSANLERGETPGIGAEVVGLDLPQVERELVDDTREMSDEGLEVPQPRDAQEMVDPDNVEQMEAINQLADALRRFEEPEIDESEEEQPAERNRRTTGYKCNCKVTQCSNFRCGCRKLGIECSVYCGCRSFGCCN